MHIEHLKQCRERDTTQPLFEVVQKDECAEEPESGMADIFNRQVTAQTETTGVYTIPPETVEEVDFH